MTLVTKEQKTQSERKIQREKRFAVDNEVFCNLIRERILAFGKNRRDVRYMD